MSKRHKRTPGSRRYERRHDAELTREPVRPRSAFEDYHAAELMAERILQDPTSDAWDRASATAYLNGRQT